MNKKNGFLIFLDEFNSFQNKLKNQLNKSISNPIECYLLNRNWKNTLLNYFNNNKIYNTLKTFSLSSFPELNKSFIDNFNSAINYFKYNAYINYVSKSIMEGFIDKQELNKFHSVSLMYAANKKIIIDFQHTDYNKSLLIINQFEEDLTTQKKFIILFANNNCKNKKKIFEDLLSENITNSKDINNIKLKYKEYLIEIEDYLKNNKIKINININESYVKEINNYYQKEIKNILHISIYLYYYEKYMATITLDDNYYLINPEWMEKYKKIYNYDHIFNSLKIYDQSNKIINYYNIDKYINIITEKCKDNFINLKIQLN